MAPLNSVVATAASSAARKAGHTLSVTIDPRRHDAVLLNLDNVTTDTLVRRLHRAGVRTAVLSSGDSAALIEAADRLAVRPGRCVVVAGNESAVAAGRSGGFALVIGVDRTQGGRLPGAGADVVVADLGEIAARTVDRPMSSLPDAMTVLGSADGLGLIGHPAVFFDFDGTLSEIVNDPETACLAPGAAEALQALSVRCPIAVVSGRDLANVEQRVGLSGIWYAGSHGFELTGPDGTHHQNDTAAAAVPVLADAAGSLHAQLDAIDGVMVEHKRFAVAVHYRNVARARVGEVLATVHTAGRRHALRVTTGREVIELRPDIDWDKGKTLRFVISRLADDDDRGVGTGSLSPIYLGDDITDEDAFDAVREPDLHGIGIVVRHTEDGDRRTAAQFALDNPGQVVRFVRQLADHIDVASSAGTGSAETRPWRDG